MDAENLDLGDKVPECYPFSMVGLGPDTPATVCTNVLGARTPLFIRRGGEHGAELPVNMDYVRIEAPDWNECNPFHNHEFYELALFRRGRATHRINGAETDMHRGEVLVLAPETVHSYRCPPGLCYTDLHLAPGWMLEDLKLLWSVPGLVRTLLTHALWGAPLPDGFLHLRSTEEETLAWEAELDAIERESMEEYPSLATINGCFLKILGILNKAYLRARSTPDLPVRPELWEAAERIERIIAEGGILDIDRLAREVAMSRKGLERMFRHGTGRTPFAYFQTRRLEHARRMLTDRDRSVTDIAHDLGFADLAHFSRLFSSHTGMSPRAYRKRQQRANRQIAPR